MNHSSISVSELQKNISSVLKNNKSVRIITQNNKPTGALISASMLEFLEKFGVLEDIEDYALIHDPQSQKLLKEPQKKSIFLTHKEVWT